MRLLTAVVLLGIFVSVHVAKAFHTHARVNSISKLAAGTDTVQDSSACATCDYHFTKDSYDESVVWELREIPCYQPVFRFYKSYLASSIGLHYSDRGPPALA